MSAPGTPYRGIPVACTWCIWERRKSPATRTVETPKGKRQLCDKHAMAGRWFARGRRVSAVAS